MWEPWMKNNTKWFKTWRCFVICWYATAVSDRRAGLWVIYVKNHASLLINGLGNYQPESAFFVNAIWSVWGVDLSDETRADNEGLMRTSKRFARRFRFVCVTLGSLSVTQWCALVRHIHCVDPGATRVSRTLRATRTVDCGTKTCCYRMKRRMPWNET